MTLWETIRGMLALLLFQTSWSDVGRQGLGLKFVLLILARTPEQRQRIMAHCQGALNTNPFAAGAVVGTVIKAEYQEQELRLIDRFAAIIQTTLAASGDRLFWSTLRPTLTALAVVLGLFGSPFAPLAFLIGFNATSQGTRFIGLRDGFLRGRDVASVLMNRFGHWTRSLEPFATLLTGMVMARGILGGHPLVLSLPRILLVPTALLAYFTLRRGFSQTYLLLGLLLILLLAKVCL